MDKPVRVSRPGKIIREEMNARGWTFIDLAKKMGRVPGEVLILLHSETIRISERLALELSEAFGTSAEFWTNLEMNYKAWKERQINA